MSWFYLSFAGESEWLGACWVEADGDDEKQAVWNAITRAHALGINPGGEVAVAGPVDSARMDEQVPTEMRERLLSLADLPDPVKVTL